MPKRPHAAATARIIVNGLTAASAFGLIAVFAAQAGPAEATAPAAGGTTGPAAVITTSGSAPSEPAAATADATG
ncbi:MAG: hypothetical protein RL531_1725, partial [Actinomycetota bacterium]